MDSKLENQDGGRLKCKWNTNTRKRRNRRRLKRRKYKKKMKKLKLKKQMDNYQRRTSSLSEQLSTTQNIPIPPMFMNLPGAKWFIENYKFCQNHQETQWKRVYHSKIEGLKYENKMLRQRMLQMMEENQMSSSNVYQQSECTFSDPNDDGLFENDSNDEDVEMTDDILDSDDEEFKKFLDITAQHQTERNELEKMNDEEYDHDEEDSTCNSPSPDPEPVENKTEQMVKLYGEDAAMIMGMESALEMRFQRNMVRYKPPLWPCTAIRNPHLRL